MRSILWVGLFLISTTVVAQVSRYKQGETVEYNGRSGVVVAVVPKSSTDPTGYVDVRMSDGREPQIVRFHYGRGLKKVTSESEGVTGASAASSTAAIGAGAPVHGHGAGGKNIVAPEALAPPKAAAEPTVSAQGLKLIKFYEGFREKSYVCPAGHLTIGYGHLCSNTDCLEDCDRILTEAQATAVLECDLKIALQQVNKTFPNLDQNERDVLVSFVMNLGNRFSSRNAPSLRAAKDAFVTAKSGTDPLTITEAKVKLAAQMTRWNKGGGKVLEGLRKRRLTEAHLFLYERLPESDADRDKLEAKLAEYLK